MAGRDNVGLGRVGDMRSFRFVPNWGYSTRWQVFALLVSVLFSVQGFAQKTGHGTQSVAVRPVLVMPTSGVEVVGEGDDSFLLVEDGGEVAQWKRGAVLTVKGEPAKYIEVHPAENPFPPRVVRPFAPGQFVIVGPGKYWVSIRGGEIPTWVEVDVMGGDPPPVEPPDEPDELDALVEWAKDNLPDDTETAKALASAWTRALARVEPGSPIGRLRGAVVEFRRDAMLQNRNTARWDEWLKPLDAAMERMFSADEVDLRYRDAMERIIQVLE